jgi:elongation factor P--(R)-beta-lysine ligase
MFPAQKILEHKIREALIARAAYRAHIHTFFRERGVVEVVTPHQLKATGTDIHLTPFSGKNSSGERWFLHTSPEFEMKRLLAEGSGDIFQICQVFRDEEVGRWHRPEFSLLEWYREGITLFDLETEVSALLETVFELSPVHRMSVEAACQQYAAWSPWSSDAVEHAKKRWPDTSCGDDLATWFDFVMVSEVEPKLKDFSVCCLFDYPITHAALARIESEEGREVARRFEYYVHGVEVANGFDELTDPVEQRARFQKDQTIRQAQGLPIWPIDEDFLNSLEAMPDCCGVAVGLDRLSALSQDNKNRLD